MTASVTANMGGVSMITQSNGPDRRLASSAFMTVDLSQPAAKFYTVIKGDTLSKIAKEFYGNANDYMKIFEANKPMLSHPDKIYPGQNLRIPAE